MNRGSATKWLSLLLVSILTGCAGYGPTNTKRIILDNGLVVEVKTVKVRFFENKTLEPRLVVAVNRALKRNLQQDGTFELKTSGNADLLVTGELTDFLRGGVSFRPGDILTVQDYHLQLKAKIKVTYRRETGDVIMQEEVTGSSIVRVGNDFTASQRQMVPLIADLLARQITSLIVDGDWPETLAAP